jgi:LysR family transcriptional regulator, glycine cleavage system transcriptional activator
MAEFAAAHPLVDLRLSASRHLVDFRREGIDAAIRYGPGGWPDVNAELLAKEHVFPVCSPAYAAELGLADPGDLARATLLHSDIPDSWQDWFAAAGCPGLAGARGVYMDEDAALLRAAAESEGIALGRSLLVVDDLARGRLIAPFAVCLPATFSYWFVSPLRARADWNFEVVRRWLASEFQKSEGWALDHRSRL